MYRENCFKGLKKNPSAKEFALAAKEKSFSVFTAYAEKIVPKIMLKVTCFVIYKKFEFEYFWN